MNFISINFFLFAILALGIYYWLPKRPQNAWLLFVSYGFIVTWAWHFAFVLAAVTVANFILASHLRVDDQGRRGLLGVGIAVNVFVLVFFRSVNFYLPELEAWFTRMGISAQSGSLQILIPLGLSYYVLQVISYLVDVYRGQLQAETDLINFSLYLAYFPKLIAGPLERAKSFLPKLEQPRVVDNRVIAQSVSLIFVGLLRKLLIADVLNASILSDVFLLPQKYSPPELIIWLVIYAFAIYNDFAGYTNIVRGISGFFGIELSSNFQTPYFSRNFTEFWRRWHITLSEWLRDYIYFPISRFLRQRNPNPRNLANFVLPPMVTMLVSGIWHGFSLNMILWGAMHGLYLIVERIPTLWLPSIAPQNRPVWRQGLAMPIVFSLVILAWVPFGWGLPAAFDFFGALFDWSNMAIRYRRLFLVLPFIFLSMVVDFLQYRNRDEFVFLKWPRLAQATSMAVIMLLVFIVTAGDFEQPFVYQAF
jgi:D-alanyl-lipoteichoic acid acyltransferase DltB (MBOAT superfamily)